MFNRRTLLYGVIALTLSALVVTAGKGGGKEPPPEPEPPADPAILYQVNSGWPDYTLWVMNEDGSNQTEILSPPEYAIASYDWSPDNTQLVVLTRRANNNNVWEMHIADADGSNMAKISDGSGNNTWISQSPGDPQWRVFPNGEERIVYHWTDSSGTGRGAWTMKTDGTDHRPLFSATDRYDRCLISRDGALAAISYQYAGGYRHVELGTVTTDDSGGPVIESIVPLSEVPGSPLTGGNVQGPRIDPTNTLVAVEASQVADGGLWIIPIASPADAWRVPVDGGQDCSWLNAWTIVYQRSGGKAGTRIFQADIYLGQEVELASPSHRRDSLAHAVARN